MTSEPLTQAEATLQRTSPAIASLPHVIDTLSQLLDASTNASLPIAAASGSVRLIHRVAARLLNDQSVQPALREHLFARALVAAIKKNDLPVVQEIHLLHPEPLVVPSLELAAEHGSLELVQWVVMHRHDQSCCSLGLQNVCPHILGRALARVGPQDMLSVVRWLLEGCGLSLSDVWSGGFNWQFAKACVRDLELLRWLLINSHLKPEDVDKVMWLAIEDPETSTETVRFLVEQHLANRTTLTMETRPKLRPFLADIKSPEDEMEESFITSLFIASLQRGKEGTVEYMLSCRLSDSLRDKVVYEAVQPGAAKVLQWTRKALGDVTHNPGRTLHGLGLSFRAAQYCHVETLQWLFESLGHVNVDSIFDVSVTEDDVIKLFEWMLDVRFEPKAWPYGATNHLAARGYLDATKWLHDHGLSIGETTRAMDVAAANGHLELMKWLSETHRGSLSRAAMDGAAGRGHLDVIKWLHEQGHEGASTSTMTCAAVGGHVDVLEWLHENCVDGCVRCTLRGLLRAPRAYVRTDSIFPMFPVVNTLQWLGQRVLTTRECHGACLPVHRDVVHVQGHLTSFVAGVGDMKLLEYLHEHHRDEFRLNRGTPGASAHALVRGGCLSGVKWMFAHHREAFDWNLVVQEAQFRSQRMATWLTSAMGTDRQSEPRN